MQISVVGAGLGGLTVSALLSQAGHAVTLYERSRQPGGRARTDRLSGRLLNRGPHALFTAGPAARTLKRLGLRWRGATPLSPPRFLWEGRLIGLFGEGPLGLGALWGALRAARSTAPLEGTVADWLATLPAPTAGLVGALLRLSSYCAAPALQSAAAARAQLRCALGGVAYLDGGWQQLVDGLAGWPGITRRLGDDQSALPDGDAVVLAGDPALARRMGVALPDLLPVRAATLDLALSRPLATRFVLGLDAPLYLADHGQTADLGGPVAHVARYLHPEEPDVSVRESLEGLLEAADPDWRSAVIEARFLPALTVTHRVDRPGEQVPLRHTVDGRPVFLVGDWVGEEGMLLDRALASAAAVADALGPGEGHAR